MNFINLEVIIAILTLLIAILTPLFVSERKQKEKREIIEKIIQPLQENLDNIMKRLSKSGNFTDANYWRWETIKKEESYIINKIKIKVKELIENFNREWEQFQRLYPSYNFHHTKKELNEKVCLMLIDYFQQSDFSNSFPKELLLQILQNKTLYETNPLYEWVSCWSFEKSTKDSFSPDFSINFFELIFFNLSPQTFINKKIKESQIDQAKRKCKIMYSIKDEGLLIEKEIKERDWEKIGDFLREEVNKEGSNLLEYFKYSREVYYKAKKLQEELEKYKSELTMGLFEKVKKKLKNIF